MSGIAVGAGKGFIVTKRPTFKSSRKWFAGQKKDEIKNAPGRRVKVARSVIRECVGFAPYERRIMEILKGGGTNPQKRAWRFAKNRLGTHTRAKKKVVEMERAVSAAPIKKKAPKKANKKGGK
mmetsp:Transcript_22039/g.30866  ORF Transcript_22039/g.30866 Transcript_22039/m.30866 type:complete len:123 (+) Transcript_22039:31-399(+)|eukprot:CAMPEP_0185258942 /NCGR_PEP_ID=MMETSP1359-20130426/7812_1 /TAXON_ID=552665 /ORGANISM="Bigelowiella longifila, Strain CCMP242" /LENGTH=122 /DNA_ID=CAMNT_0027844667 /DNA_START=96 /DNA_END=464 /DNA_ORIENTATION=+